MLPSPEETALAAINRFRFVPTVLLSSAAITVVPVNPVLYLGLVFGLGVSFSDTGVKPYLAKERRLVQKSETTGIR